MADASDRLARDAGARRVPGGFRHRVGTVPDHGGADRDVAHASPFVRSRSFGWRRGEVVGPLAHVEGDPLRAGGAIPMPRLLTIAICRSWLRPVANPASLKAR